MTDDEVLAEKATLIRACAKRAVADLIVAGAALAEARAMLPHGGWLPWLRREFSWSERTARNLIGIHELSKSETVADLERLDIRVLYAVAAKSTPDAARKEILGRAAAGDIVKIPEAQQIISDARPPRRVRVEITRATKQIPYYYQPKQRSIDEQREQLVEPSAIPSKTEQSPADIVATRLAEAEKTLHELSRIKRRRFSASAAECETVLRLCESIALWTSEIESAFSNVARRDLNVAPPKNRAH